MPEYDCKLSNLSKLVPYLSPDGRELGQKENQSESTGKAGRRVGDFPPKSVLLKCERIAQAVAQTPV